MDGIRLFVILGRIEMTADSMSAAVVARNNIFDYSRDSGQPWKGS